MPDLPPFRRGRPVGYTDAGGNVYFDPEFVRAFFEPLTRQVAVSDGAAPGGIDAVSFASYPPQPASCIAASYPARDSGGAVAASYTTQTTSAPVRASYGAQGGGVTLARY